jgi:hypothetical protein
MASKTEIQDDISSTANGAEPGAMGGLGQYIAHRLIQKPAQACASSGNAPLATETLPGPPSIGYPVSVLRKPSKDQPKQSSHNFAESRKPCAG